MAKKDVAGSSLKISKPQAKQIDIDLNRIQELKDSAREHDALESRVKDVLKALGAGDYKAGSWKCRVELKLRTVYNVPEDVKAKYKTEGTAVYTSWEKA